METLLLATLLLPLAGALVLAGNRQTIRQAALITTLLTLAGAAVLVFSYPVGSDKPFAGTDVSWLGAAGAALDVRFSVALDGLSLWLFGLTALLMVTAVLISWTAVGEQVTAYYRLLLVLETGMLGVFVARDIILFYVFFEFTLIPLFFLIGIWGSRQRRYAAMKFFLFTLAGSVLTFLGLLTIVLWSHQQTGTMTFSIGQLTDNLRDYPMDRTLQICVFLGLFAGFAIKVPLFPLHTWLPLAHVEAPAAASVILAGVLLKIGTYAFVRFSLPMLPEAAAACMPWMLWLSVAGIIYGALVALAQSNIKRLIAYSSVSHMGFCMLGIFALNPLGIQGGVLQMINHGLSTGGLFALVGMLYQRYHTRNIADLGGIARQTPVLAFFMIVMTLSSIGLPGLNGFVGEFLLLLGMFQRAWVDAPAAWAWQFQVISVLAVAGVVLGAWYMLYLVQRVFFGQFRRPEHKPEEPPVRDLGLREVLSLSPLVVFILWIGIQPDFFLKRISPTLNNLTAAACALAEKESGDRGSGFGHRASGIGDGESGIGNRGRRSPSPLIPKSPNPQIPTPDSRFPTPDSRSPQPPTLTHVH